jgi:hypothetical protein
VTCTATDNAGNTKAVRRYSTGKKRGRSSRRLRPTHSRGCVTGRCSPQRSLGSQTW